MPSISNAGYNTYNTHLILSFVRNFQPVFCSALRLLPWVIRKAPYFGVVKALFSGVAIDLLQSLDPQPCSDAMVRLANYANLRMNCMAMYGMYDSS